jgi:hypothetical protein
VVNGYGLGEVHHGGYSELARMTAHARLDDVPSLAAEILTGKIRGRVVIDL